MSGNSKFEEVIMRDSRKREFFHHTVKSVCALEGNRLRVEFDEGVVKIYDVTRLYDVWPVFRTLEASAEFYKVHVDMGGYGIAWNEKIDLDCNELWENGTEIVAD